MKHFIFLLYLLPVISNSQLYLRIPIHKVEDTVNEFLDIHNFNNCFQNKISFQSLDLKCWKNDGLYTIHLSFEKTYSTPDYVEHDEYEKYDHKLLNYIQDDIDIFMA